MQVAWECHESGMRVRFSHAWMEWNEYIVIYACIVICIVTSYIQQGCARPCDDDCMYDDCMYHGCMYCDEESMYFDDEGMYLMMNACIWWPYIRVVYSDAPLAARAYVSHVSHVLQQGRARSTPRRDQEAKGWAQNHQPRIGSSEIFNW